MALPTNTDRFGEIKENAEPIEDPQKEELDAAEYNRLAEDEAQMTRTSYKVMCRFVATVAAAPQTFQAVAGRSHAGVGAGDLPSVQKTADGNYVITWPATFTNPLGEEETLSIGFSHGGVDAGGTKGLVFTLNSQNNTISLEVTDLTGAASDLGGAAITVWGMQPVAKFGRAPFSRRFGGGIDPLETAHLALLEALAPGYAEDGKNIPEDSPAFAEAYAHALAVTMIWRLNGRLRNSLVPMKMLETMTTWEEACKLRPAMTDNVWVRRRRLAAKFRGLVGNTLKDIYDAVANLCPQNFLGLKGPDASQDVTYSPGINPGPPGFEWSSTRAIIAVRLQRAGLSDSDFAALVGQIALTLDGILPAWMGFQIGTDEGGFIAGVAIGVTLLGGP